jgi:hypothetical protein
MRRLILFICRALQTGYGQTSKNSVIVPPRTAIDRPRWLRLLLRSFGPLRSQRQLLLASAARRQTIWRRERRWTDLVAIIISLAACCAGQQVTLNIISPPLDASDPNYVPIMNYVVPSRLLYGASFQLPWAAIDNGPHAPGGQYQWTAFDNAIQAYVAAGKKVNVIIWPICELQPNPICSGNAGTPAYVLNDPSLPYVSCSSTLLPIPYSSVFKSAYKQFIAQVLAHYADNTNIGYIRFGFSRGGEVFPWCASAMAAAVGLTVPQWRDAYWLPYDKEMLDYIRSLNASIQILAPTTAGTPYADLTWPDTEAAQGVADGFGFGSQGLQKSDIANYYAGKPTNADWAALFNKYMVHIPLELQTLGPSDAAGTLNDGSNQAQTGPLPPLLAFGVQQHATIFELYLQDWELALVPGYINNLGQSNAQFGQTYVAAMRAAIGLGKWPSSTSLSSSLSPSTYGQPVTFTATVSTGSTASGTVVFKTGSGTLGSSILSGGTATYTTGAAQLTGGTDSITAVYKGDSTHAGSTSALFPQTVEKASTSTMLTSSANPAEANTFVRFTATVSSPSGVTPTTGTVTFKQGSTVLRAGTMTSPGIWTLNCIFPSSGTFSITAVYGGTGNFISSISPPLSQSITP